jgi:hypothetical protein
MQQNFNLPILKNPFLKNGPNIAEFREITIINFQQLNFVEIWGFSEVSWLAPPTGAKVLKRKLLINCLFCKHETTKNL